jgi:hypothetical protein
LAEEGPERPLREGEADENAEDAKRSADIDAGAEQEREQADERQCLGERNLHIRAGKPEAREKDQENEKKDGRDHDCALPVPLTASSASCASSS